MPVVRCTRCQTPYPQNETPYLCPKCGGVFDFDTPPVFDSQRVDRCCTGLWRYRSAFSLPANAPIISLGEGDTPLIPWMDKGDPVWLKLESLNPTGSYKDRGSAVLLSHLAARGVEEAVEDSSGNAGASFAAYAARAGVKARVFVPEAASGPKRGQIEAYGATLVRVPGPRSAAAAAVLQEVQHGAVYGSHAYLPFGLEGIATLAYELFEQLGQAPGTVIAPVGHGGLLVGVMRGFQALMNAHVIDHLPFFVGVQARACAPAWFASQHGIEAMDQVQEGSTIAEGVRVQHPVRAAAILDLFDRQSGKMVAIDEADIMPAYQELARGGVHVEPTSALVWAAYRQLREQMVNSGMIPGPIVLILSGAGLKYQSQIS
jgi:threonine synthase